MLHYEMGVPLAVHRLLVVYDDPLGRERILSLLQKGRFQVQTAGSAAEAEALLAGKFDLVLVDLEVTHVDGVDFIRRLAKLKIPIVIFAAGSHDQRIIAAIRAGALGCIFFEDLGERLVASVEEALAGGRPMSRGLGPMLFEHVRQSGRHSSHQRKTAKGLTDRELSVLQQLARGFCYEDVGKTLGVSLNTVRTHVRTIYDKLDVNSRTEAVLLAMKLGLVKRTPYPGRIPRT
jgi:DNA-binding NarL/FixJ family response regulator